MDFAEFLKGFPENDIKEFFKNTFTTPLHNQLLSDDKTSAEEIRQKLKQTQHITQTLINLSKK